jgi:ZIP family zinc transporter
MEWFLSLGSVMQAFLAALFTYAMTALGAGLVFFSGKVGGRALAAMTGGAAGIMIAASFFSLLLPALDYIPPMPVFIVLSVGFLLGGLFIVGGDIALQFMQNRRGKIDDRARECLLLYSAVTLHNIPEGLAIGVAFGTANGTVGAVMLAVGIGIQNLPEGTCVAYPLKSLGYSNFRSFFYSQASGWAELVSAVAGAFLSGAIEGAMPWILAFSAGAMIAVVCSELIPESFESHKLTASLGVIFGFALMMFLDLALG